MRNRAAPIGGLLLLCALWATASLQRDLLPGWGSTVAPTLSGQAVPLALVAATAGVLTLARRKSFPGGRQFAIAILVGLGMFAAPAILLQLANGSISDSTRVALFSLVPVFAVVLEPHLGSGGGNEGALGSALVAVGGTLLLFPFELPQSLRDAAAWSGVLAAVVSIAATNCVAVRSAREDRARSISAFASIAAGSAAVVLGAVGAFLERGTGSILRMDIWTLPEVIALVLLFWLMTCMSAIAMTTRFLIAPLIANLIEVAILRPRVSLRDWAGFLLIAAGTGWLLLVPQMKKGASTLKLDLT
ncbi:MAG TPA: hypothetical protein VGI45_17725 [Terracidiphilus sp.]